MLELYFLLSPSDTLPYKLYIVITPCLECADASLDLGA